MAVPSSQFVSGKSAMTKPRIPRSMNALIQGALTDGTMYTLERAVFDMLWAAKQEGNPHDSLTFAVANNVACDAMGVHALCRDCERSWGIDITYQALEYASGNHQQTLMLLATQVKALRHAIDTSACFAVPTLAELCEWVTGVVAQAMPVGITYSALQNLAEQAGVCAPSDIEVVLETLKFGTRHRLWTPNTCNTIRVKIVDGKMVEDYDQDLIKLPPDHPLADPEWED